jgi:hypothetical protein
MGIQELVKRFFVENGWKYSTPPDKPIFSLGLSGENGKFQCFVVIDEQERLILVHSICGFNTPKDRRQGMAELLTRINFVLKVGNFEMDFEDGEIRFKTSVRIADSDASIELIEHLILPNILTIDKALPILMEMIYGTASPESLCEKFKASND